MIRQRWPFVISYWSGSPNNAVELRAGKHFRFDLDAVNSFCLSDLSPRLVDFLRISASVYVVDRLVKRGPKNGTKTPPRTIGLKVSVLEAAFWNRAEIRQTISELLEFVSGGDLWDFEFLQDASEFCRREWLGLKPYYDESPLVCLSSGGLDSAAGLAARMLGSPGRPVLPVTVWHQPGQRQLVRDQLDLLRRQFHVPVDPLIVKVAMMWSPHLDKRKEELTQRCRSFLFASLGAIAAIMHNQQVVEVFESGVGAINPPFMAGMVGSMTTKNAHPKFLRLMSRLASLVAEKHPVEFCLPFQNETKGQVVRQLAATGLEQLAHLSVSCVHYPLRYSRSKQCGVCPGCILRRQAMVVAGIKERERTYKYDIFDSSQRANRIPAKRLQYLKACLMQVAWLRDVETRMQLPAAFHRHLLSTEVLEPGQSHEKVIRLFARYRDEWMNIVSERHMRRFEWTKLLAAHRPETQGVSHVSA